MKKVGLVYVEHQHSAGQAACLQKLERLNVDAVILYTSYYNTNIHTRTELYQVASLSALFSVLSRFDDTDLVVCSTDLSKYDILFNINQVPQNFIALNKDNHAYTIRHTEAPKLLKLDFASSVAELKESINLSGSSMTITKIKPITTNNTDTATDTEIKYSATESTVPSAIDRITPFFRVIMPVHRSTTTLPNAINSILRQTFTNYMVIVCDDGSPEPDAEINKNTVSLLGNKGIFIHTETNLYAGAARNLAMKHCTDAKYTLFLDADDEFLDANIFSRLHDFILAHDSPDVIVLPYINRRGVDTTRIYSIINSPTAFANEQSAIAPWTKCIRTNKVAPFSEGLRRSNDVLQHYLTVDTVETVAAFTEPVVRYKEESDTTMFGAFGKQNRHSLGAITGFLKSMLELLDHEWIHEYTRIAIGKKLIHTTTMMIPNLMKELGPGVIAELLKKRINNEQN